MFPVQHEGDVLQRYLRLPTEVAPSPLTELKSPLTRCERVVKDMAPQHQDVVHLQVAVVKSIIDVVSKKQLGGVLRLHEIDYDPTDTQKVLRSRLKNHIGLRRIRERGAM